MILIISKHEDVHARAVLHHLRAADAKSWLLDLSQFPRHSSVALRFCNDDRSKAEFSDSRDLLHDFRSCRAAWWRRPQPFRVEPAIEDREHSMFAFNECRETFSGLWNSLDAFWINHPSKDEVAHKKTLQLRVAEKVGLDIPDTLVTNDPEQARAFVAEHGVGSTVYKVFSASERLWRETRVIREDEVSQLELVQFAPLIFQEYVAGVDLRVTVVGDQMFAGAIDATESSYPVDFRMNMAQARITPFELPDEVQAGIKRLMKELGLVYGAVDIRRTEEGRYAFLEVNPAGQWLFVEQQTGQPISEAIANLLIEKAGAPRTSEPVPQLA